MNYDWMDEARQLAAQCWCDEETSDREMDAVLCEAVAKRIAAWMDTAAAAQRNAEFYRDLLDRCAKWLWPDAYRADDGVMHDSPIRLKIPKLVEKLVLKMDRYERHVVEASHEQD